MLKKLMNRSKHDQPDRLIIFSRYPIPGKTKTRLIPALGKVGAADLQRKFTEAIFRTARKLALSHSIGVEMRFEGGSEQKMRQWLGAADIFSSQPQGSLGTRMRIAFEEAFQQGCRRVVLIGSDIPEITNGHMAKAFQSLDEHDLVLGPSTDGGYWLVGMKTPCDIFQGIDWGTDVVLEQTLNASKKIGLNTCFLDQLNDIDTSDDLKKWNSQEADPKTYVSVVIPALNEEKNVQKAIFSARDEDAEVIVVDGGSSDRTLEKAMAAGAQVLKSEPGRALQQNFGAKFARGKVLLFLHADTVLPTDYVDYVFEALMNPETVAGAFRFKTDWDRPMMRVAEFLTNFRSRYLKLPYGDQGLFVRKAVFEASGGFPQVSIAEDLFLIRQLAGKGRIEIVPAEAVTSARRWQKLGVLRTTLINQFIVTGCYLGVPPGLLKALYRGKGTKQPLDNRR